MNFDPRQMSPAEYRDRIRALESRLSRERAACQETEAELAWWRQGMELFAPGAKSVELEPIGPPPTPAATNLGNGRKPSLREAILAIIREGEPKKAWQAPDLIRVLSQRGWMPNGDHAEHIVRSRLSTLTKAGELQRVSYGKYGLPKGAEWE